MPREAVAHNPWYGAILSYHVPRVTLQHPETAAQGRERLGKNGKASIWMMVAFNWNVTNLEQHRIETFVSLWPRNTAGIDTRGCIYHCRALRDRVSTVIILNDATILTVLGGILGKRPATYYCSDSDG